MNFHHATRKFSTADVEKVCGKELFAADKFLKHLDFQQIAHVSGEPSYSLRSAVCIYETQSWREYVRGERSRSRNRGRSDARLRNPPSSVNQYQLSSEP